jgi:hypothetical protein
MADGIACDEVRRQLIDDGGDHRIEIRDLVMQFEVSTSEGFEGDAIGRLHITIGNQVGPALAQARCRLTKRVIKQVDRLLSNHGVVVWDMFGPWVAEMVGQRRSIVVAMDWTDFDADDQTTLALNLVTNHGRATPLLWLTVFKGELKDKRNDSEHLCLLRLAAVARTR